MKKLYLLTIAILLVMGLSLPASAATFKIGDADFSLSGQIRVNAEYQITDMGDTATGTEDSKTNFFIRNPATSRFGIMSRYEKVTGFFEMGVRDETDSRNKLFTRHAFMSYDLGGGNSFLFGQTYSSLALHFPDQELNNGRAIFGYGNLYTGRVNMLRYAHKGAAISYNIELQNTDSTTATNYVTNTPLPALAGSLTYKTGGLTVTPSFLIQQYELTADSDTVDDIDVLAYAMSLDAVYALNKVSRIDAEFWYGQNVALFADVFNTVSGTSFGSPVYVAGDIEDTDSFGGWLQVTFPVGVVEVHVGGGYAQAEIDDSIGTEDNWSRYSFFTSAKYSFTPQFFIQPEIAYFDNGDDANGVNDLGSYTFIGVHFRYTY